MTSGRLILKLWIIVFSINDFIIVNGGIYYKFTKLQCYPREKYIQNATCSVKAISWTKSVANMESDIKGTLRNITMRTETYYKDYANQYKPFVLHIEFNICKALAMSKSGVFLQKYVMNHLALHTNVNHSCPFTGHLSARNFQLDELSLPLLPLQQYKMNFYFSEGYPADLIGEVVFFVEVGESPKAKDKRKMRPK